MTPQEFKTYFEHTLGLNLLGIWSMQHDIKMTKDNILYIPLKYASLFKLALPTPQEKYCFFACERDEINWMKRIKWSRLNIDEKNKLLILISKKIEGDKAKVPDITEIAIAIPYDSKEKIKLLDKETRISLKEFYIDSGEYYISNQMLFLVPIKRLAENEPYFLRQEKQKYTTNYDLMVGNITRTNVFKAKYRGDRIEHFTDSRLNAFAKDFDIRNYEGQFEKGTFVSTPEDYEKFAKTEYDYDADWIKQRNQNNTKVLGQKEDLEKLNEEILKRWY